MLTRRDGAQAKVKLKTVGLGHLRDPADKGLRVVYVASNILSGLAVPVFLYLFSQFANALVPGMSSSHPWKFWCGLMVLTACADFVFVALGTGCAELTAERQLRLLRLTFMTQIMRQEIAFFDQFDATTLATKLNLSSRIFREARGFASGLVFMYSGLSGGCLIMAALQSPQMAGVCVCTLPLMIFAGYHAGKIHIAAHNTARRAWESVASFAREGLDAIRTVKAFSLESAMQRRYEEAVDQAYAAAIYGTNVTALAMGVYWALIFGTSAFGFWYGAKMIADGLDRGDVGCGHGVNGGRGTGMSGNQAANIGLCFDAGKASGVFIDVVCAAFFLGKLLPLLSIRVRARRALSEIVDLCSRESGHDPEAEDGIQLEQIVGDVTFENVTFSYSSRPDAPVFEDLTLHIPAGRSTALVGASGMGKSTIVQLLERFYDPDEGDVKLDGRSLKTYNLRWLRDQIALVAQEPKLFASTIADNIRIGREDATMDEIRLAAGEANAHAFISRLPQGYDTWVGEDGGQLSGGQKQRIAIARAILRRAPILILDEATSALDNHSEKMVQDTLDRLLAQRARTTIIIAHRLSTVRTADKIIVLDKHPGRGASVAEQGTHEELARRPGGLYAALVTTQTNSPAQFLSSQENVMVARQFSRDLSQRDQSILALKAEFMQADAGDTHAEKDDETSWSSSQTVPVGELFRRVFEPSRERKWLFVTGCVGAALNGAVWPIFAVAFSYFMDAYGQLNSTLTRRMAWHWAFVMGGIGLLAFLGQWWQAAWLGQCGELNARRLTSELHASLLGKEMFFYDRAENSPGALVHLLTHDVLILRGWSADNIGVAISATSCILIGAITAMNASWKLGLTALASLLLMVPLSYLSARLTTPGELTRTHRTEEMSQLLIEVIIHIRTINAYNLHRTIQARYAAKVDAEFFIGRYRAFSAALVNGGVNCLRMLVFTAIFYYGGELTRRGEIDARQLIQGSLCLLLAAMQMGRTLTSGTSTSEGESSARKIFALMDYANALDELGRDVHKIGDLSFDQVSFRFPSRPDNPVFENVSFTVPRGKVVALVGGSGCGKSTVVQLIERFYEVTRGGVILVNGTNIRNFSAKSLRGRIGVVSQEPSLFLGTVEENVAYGKPFASLEDVEAACRTANAWDFVQSLPRKMQTNVGRGGAALSGGQKQRVAIARAIVRQPDLLILDEATSALDGESEAAVQEALSRLMAERAFTTLIIAHRLTTVKKADLIVVFHGENGSQIAEMGTHEQLMRNPNGIYRGLVRIANAD